MSLLIRQTKCDRRQSIRWRVGIKKIYLIIGIVTLAQLGNIYPAYGSDDATINACRKAYIGDCKQRRCESGWYTGIDCTCLRCPTQPGVHPAHKKRFACLHALGVCPRSNGSAGVDEMFFSGTSLNVTISLCKQTYLGSGCLEKCQSSLQPQQHELYLDTTCSCSRCPQQGDAGASSSSPARRRKIQCLRLTGACHYDQSSTSTPASKNLSESAGVNIMASQEENKNIKVTTNGHQSAGWTLGLIISVVLMTVIAMPAVYLSKRRSKPPPAQADREITGQEDSGDQLLTQNEPEPQLPSRNFQRPQACAIEAENV